MSNIRSNAFSPPSTTDISPGTALKIKLCVFGFILFFLLISFGVAGYLSIRKIKMDKEQLALRDLEESTRPDPAISDTSRPVDENSQEDAEFMSQKSNTNWAERPKDDISLSLPLKAQTHLKYNIDYNEWPPELRAYFLDQEGVNARDKYLFSTKDDHATHRKPPRAALRPVINLPVKMKPMAKVMIPSLGSG